MFLGRERTPGELPLLKGEGKREWWKDLYEGVLGGERSSYIGLESERKNTFFFKKTASGSLLVFFCYLFKHRGSTSLYSNLIFSAWLCFLVTRWMNDSAT